MFGRGEELIIILVLGVLLFGGGKVKDLFKGLGEGMKEFKKATKDDDPPKPATPAPSATPPNSETRS